MSTRIAGLISGCVLVIIAAWFADIWLAYSSWRDDSSYLEHPTPSNTSAEALRLRDKLKECVAHIPEGELADETIGPPMHTHVEHPRTHAGKYIRCLAQVSDALSAVKFFYGFAGANGVFSAALGFRAKALSGAGTVRLLTVDYDRCAEGRKLLKEYGLEEFVDLRCAFVCEHGDDNRCLDEVRRDYCPSGPLGILFIDATEEGWLAARSALKVCTPKIVFHQNSGFVGAHDANSKLLHNDLHIFHWMHDSIHTPAVEARGPYRIVVNRHLSGFPLEALLKRFSLFEWLKFFMHNARRDRYLALLPRRFSIYVSADAA
eukprot:gnl/TRDRNA2_/TRDRNA2_88923_c0_seq1.p1 gnl/TRDRNA2_/TRDRNA2_88923_c0~~gnl/TRDRNA2_/TRDRNA2_88923_c0_seq1.p1  ORF type:complete len:318 (+),score=15.36 gnl/TRDRNA2_/TRDRNA2_88923_c0_seq1:22-975(+)